MVETDIVLVLETWYIEAKKDIFIPNSNMEDDTLYETFPILFGDIAQNPKQGCIMHYYPSPRLNNNIKESVLYVLVVAFSNYVMIQ